MLEESTDSEDAALSQVKEVFPTLDTIQESRESSSLSGDSSENIDITKTESSFDLSIHDNLTSDGNVTKVRWIHDRDEDDEESEDASRDAFQIEDDDASFDAFQVEDDALFHPNVDRGWASVVCLSLFLLFVFNSGLLACSGLYYVQMLEVFEESRSRTAWLGSLMNAFFMLAGPISSGVIKNAGCRTSIMVGGVLMTVGYILSATSNSLRAILFTYGIVVATGMNFVYSGQIITLAQYFHAKHSLATSVSMVGVGCGTFLMVRIMDFVISEYGWRFSFVFCAGFSLQICVLGSLIFPLNTECITTESLPENYDESNEKETQIKSMLSKDIIPINSPAFPEKHGQQSKNYLLNRSVSSLKLSIGAGYLSSSITNLNAEGRHRPSHLGSNQHSFCSRTSHFLNDMRSNQESFSYVHSGEFPMGILPFIRSNQHSFSSRGSFMFPSIHSNSQSFTIKNSQLDLYYPTVHCGLSSYQIAEEEKNRELAKSEEVEEVMNRTKSKLLLLKILQWMKKCFNDWHLEVLSDACFWFASIGMFFNMFATLKMFVIYKDMSASLGVIDYYYGAMSALGVGDILGRISMGVLSSYQKFDESLVFSINMLVMGLVIGCHILATNGAFFVIVTATFGLLYGQQCVLMTIFVSPLFGRDLLVTVFGYILFISGLGALFGAPVAGLLVDSTGNYSGVVLMSVMSCFISGLSMFCCFWIHLRRQRKNQNLAKFLA